MSENGEREMSENGEREMSTQSETDGKEIDLSNRDPKQITQIFKIDFEDVIAEPDNLHSLDIVWKCSFNTFRVTKCFCYRSLTTILGLPLSLLWGLLFALLSFLRIWAVLPCLKSCHITCLCLFQPVLMLLRAFITPILEAAVKALRGLKGLRKEA